MDEQRTLAILAWTVGSLVGVMFILNGIALSLVERAPELLAKQIVAQDPSIELPPQFPAISRAQGG